MPIQNPFTQHPSSVDESYLEHMGFALWFAGMLFLAASAALIHAILPFAFETTASRIIKALYERTSRRAAQPHFDNARGQTST